MKLISQLLTALVICSLVIFISCGGGGNTDPVDPVDTIGNQLIANWTLSSAKVDNAARDEWSGFSLNITYNPATNTGSYTASGVPSNVGASDVWPTSGSFTLEVGAATIATRNDAIPITVDVDASNLVLTFTITGSGDRVAAFDGDWEFALTN